MYTSFLGVIAAERNNDMRRAATARCRARQVAGAGRHLARRPRPGAGPAPVTTRSAREQEVCAAR
jgi:hypothetical protein